MNHVERLIERYPDLECCLDDVQQVVVALVSCFRAGGKLLICGNGGSAADSEHIVGELMKGYTLRRPVPENVREQLRAAIGDEGDAVADHLQGALPAISLTSHMSLITAYINDVSPDMIYAQQVYGYGRPGDALLGISTSGNARNVLRAVQVARAVGVRTIGLTGESGGAILPYCDVAVRVPLTNTAQVQERHQAIYHAVCQALEETFFAQ
jgi:D-sedoheptulose 7-phosphate isomerase